MLEDQDRVILSDLLKLLRLLRNDVYRPILQYMMDGWEPLGPGPDRLATITAEQVRELFETKKVDAAAQRTLAYLERYKLLEPLQEGPPKIYRMRLTRKALENMLATSFGILEAFDSIEQLFALLEIPKFAQSAEEAVIALTLVPNAELELVLGSIAPRVAEKLCESGYFRKDDTGVGYATEHLSELVAFNDLVAELLPLLD